MPPTGPRIHLGRASRPHARVAGGLSAHLATSTLLPTLIAEPMTEAVYDYLGADRQELLISDLAAAEVASALSRLVRMALLTEADASARLADFDAWRAAMSLPVDIGVEQVNQRTELRRLFFGTELEGLNGASNDLPGRHAEHAPSHRAQPAPPETSEPSIGQKLP